MAAEASDLRGPATAESSAASVHPSVAGLTNRAAGGASGGAAAAPPATLMYLPEPVANAHAAAAAAPSQAPATAPKGDAGDGDGSSRFICHICLNSPDKPVVTVCGHLHCWECLYKWLNLHRDDPQCPVCKAGIEMPGRDPSKAKVVPLYVGEENSDPRTTVPEDPPVPQRPPGERPGSQRMVGGMQFGAFAPGMAPGYPQFVANIGLFPSLFGLAFQQQAPGMGTGMQGAGAHATEAAEAAQAAQAAMQQHEAAQQEFLSRLLFMIGTFIALCLIFFP